MKITLLILGAGRCGTTSIADYLTQHQDVCFSSIKEPPFFSIEDIYQRGDKYYHSFFNPKNEKIIASADTYLFISKEAPERILKYNSNMKFIVMLRNPIERAWSSYIYALNNGHIKRGTTFEDAFLNEKVNIRTTDIVKQNNQAHFHTGLYYKHITNWMEYFPKENFLILKTEDLKNDYQQTLMQISSFLEIEEFTVIQEKKSNQAVGVKNMALHKLLIDRDFPVRRFIAKITPNALKEKLFKSGIFEKIKNYNKKQTNIKNICEEDIKLVKNYFKDDLELLSKEFKINF